MNKDIKQIQIIYKSNSYEIEVNKGDKMYEIVNDLYYNIIKPNNNISLIEKFYIESVINMGLYRIKSDNYDINKNDLVIFNVYNLYI